jgi:hypothetical protein
VFALLPLGYLHYTKSKTQLNVQLYLQIYRVIVVWFGVLLLDEVLNLRIVRNNWCGAGPIAEAVWDIVGEMLACSEAMLSASVMLLLYSRKSSEKAQEGVVDWFGRQQSHTMRGDKAL